MKQSHSLFAPVFGGFSRISRALTLMSFLMPVLASSQDCAPEWTVDISLIQGPDTTALQLVMDTSATFGFDEGLDVPCAADSTPQFACLISAGDAYTVNVVPSDGEAPIPFVLEIQNISSQTVFDWDFGDFLLDSVLVSYQIGEDTLTLDLLANGAFVLDSAVTPAIMEGMIYPSCDVLGCTNEEACNFNPDATLNDGSCEYPFFCYDCDGNCLCDEDEDGVCDPFEFPGCTDSLACNWAPVYTEEDGSCFYAQPGFDCAGFCLPVDNDECGFPSPIACGEVITATTVCADTTESEYCDQYNIGQYYHGGLWYTIMGTGDTLRATMCFEETEYDTYLSVYEGDCDDLNCVGGNDDQDEVNFFAEPCFENFLSSSVDWASEEGVEYYLHVSGSNAVTPAVGGFDFVLVCDGVEVGACLDSLACNYNPFGTFDDGTCDYTTCAGCGLASSCNFDSTAFINDLTLCDFSCYGCTDEGACNFNPDATVESGLCEYSSCAGCLDSTACNFDDEAILDAANCEYTSCVGCTDATASNYNPGATQEDGSCTYCDLLLSLPEVTGESCFNLDDGTAVVMLDSALTDSVYFELTAPGFAQSGPWDNGSFTDLPPGNYLLEVFDGDSTCSAVRVFTIAGAPDVALFLVASAPECAGGDDGSISAFVADGLDASAYQLNGEPADIGGNFLGLSAGGYVVSVEALMPNGGTCADTATISVVDPEGMTVTVDGVDGADAGEENGGIAVTVTGGAEPYSFDWEGPTGSTGMEDPDDLGSGEWTLTVTDADGCMIDTVISVPVGVEEWRSTRFAVMPNPTRGGFRVQFDRPFAGLLMLSDVTGRAIAQWPVHGREWNGTLSDHSHGVYFLRAVNGTGEVAVVRLVKQD